MEYKITRLEIIPETRVEKVLQFLQAFITGVKIWVEKKRRAKN